MSADAIILIDAEITALLGQQDALRQQVAGLDTPIAALRRVRQSLVSAANLGEPEPPEPLKVVPVPLKFPGTDIPARSALDQAEVLAEIERMEREGR